MSAIAADSEAEIVPSYSRQPEVSLARNFLQDYLQRTSGGVSFERNTVYRSFVLGASHFDSTLGLQLAALQCPQAAAMSGDDVINL
jgi:hypothetical protein